MSYSLESIAASAELVSGVRAADLQPGDCVVIQTRNSTYVLRANEDGTFDATGGWFSR